MTAHRPGPADAPLDAYVPRRGNPGYRVSRYELDLDYRVTNNRLAGHARLHATATDPLTRFSLDLADLRVTKVLVNGHRPHRHTHHAGKLTIWLDDPVPAGAVLVVDVHYAGVPHPVVGPWGEVGWDELADGVIVAGQPDGASSWFPCNDHPSDKASFGLSITTDSGYTVVSNGALTERTARASRVEWRFEQREPMATYLATLQIGRYVLVDTATEPVPQSAAIPARLSSLFRHDFGRQAEMMIAFEAMFGPYPFAEYVVVVTDDDLEMPLEAQGMSIFGANHLDGHRGLERLVAHELAHQWFGNSVTVERWQHIWLHEGFACYAEWLWSERSGGPSADALAALAWDRLARLPQDLLVGDPGPELMFDDRVYQRGALTLHAVRTAIGDDAFFETMHSWTAAHAHANATTQDFVDCATRHTDVPLHALFDAWLFTTAMPTPPRADAPAAREARPRRGRRR